MKSAIRLFTFASIATISLVGLSATAHAQSSTTTPSSTLASSTTAAPSSTLASPTTTIRPVQILPITCENALTHGAWVSSQPKGKRRNAAAKSDCGKPKQTTTTKLGTSTSTTNAPAGVVSVTSSTIGSITVGSSTTTSTKPGTVAPGNSGENRNDTKVKSNDDKAKGAPETSANGNANSNGNGIGNSGNAKGKKK